MKVEDLTGSELDYWVARAEGLSKGRANFAAFSERWAAGGPIIERERIMLEPVETWVGHIYANQRNYAYVGKTPLIAAMRCYVASKFGDEVDDSQTHHI